MRVDQHALRPARDHLHPPGQGGDELDESMVQERKADLQAVGHAVDVGVAEQGIAEIEAELELRHLVQ